MTSYLDIQKVMHDNSFDVVVDVSEKIYDYETLNLILQPLVENCGSVPGFAAEAEKAAAQLR